MQRLIWVLQLTMCIRSGKFLLGCLILILTALISCSGNHEDPVKIRFWHSFVASTHPVLEQLIRRFEADHPGIRINAQYVPTGDALIQKLITAIQSNTMPDIAWIHADFLYHLIETDAIYSINELDERYGILDSATIADIYEELLNPVRYGDHLYALPMEASVLALLYNKNLFKQAGLDPEKPPLDWSMLVEYTQKLTRDIDGDGRTDIYGFYVPVFPASGPLNIWMVLQWTPFLWQGGGDILNGSKTGAAYHGSAGVKALNLWKLLYDTMEFKNFAVAHDIGFISQKLAMILDGPWNLPRYRDIANFDWAVAPLPHGPLNDFTYISGEYMVVFRLTDYPGESFEFVSWIIRPEIQADFAMHSGYLPIRKSVASLTVFREHLKKDLHYETFFNLIRHARARIPAGKYGIRINNHIAEAMENAIVGGETAKSALENAAAKSNQLLNQ